MTDAAVNKKEKRRAETPDVAEAFETLIGGEEMEVLKQRFQADFDSVFDAKD